MSMPGKIFFMRIKSSFQGLEGRFLPYKKKNHPCRKCFLYGQYIKKLTPPLQHKADRNGVRKTIIIQ